MLRKFLLSCCFLNLAFLLPLQSLAAKRDIPITGKPVKSYAALEKKLTHYMQQWYLPGASVAIVDHGKLVYNRGFGWANLKPKQQVQPDSLFRVASVSKGLTAVAVLKLVAEDKLKLNDKVFNILSDLKPLNGKKINPKAKQLTVQNLLQMSSGWINSGAGRFDPMYGPWSRSLQRQIGDIGFPANCYHTTRLMMSMPIRFKPGSDYVYSNLDYCVLGLIINKVTQHKYGYQGYQDYIRQHVLVPYGIKNMFIGNTLLQYRLPKEVHYYRYLGPIDISHQGESTYLPYSKDQILQKNFANGGWVASSAELAKFVYQLAHDKIIPAEYVNKMLRMPAGRVASKSKIKRRRRKSRVIYYYAMGWKVRKQNGKMYWYATGSFTGTNALVMRLPGDKVAAILFNARPPIYHLWKNLRPDLRRLFIKYA